MSGLDERISMQMSQAGGGGTKKVLVVEGAGDTAFLTMMLDKPPFRDMDILSRYVIVDAGGKDAVFKILSAHKDYLGMVDKDTWSDEECEKKKRLFPTLFVLPRFCIENYIICPDEIGQALPEMEGIQQIQNEISDGVRHGCLWRAAQPLYDELMASGFNKALLQYPPPKAGEMKALVESWQRVLSVESIQSRMDRALALSKESTPEELLRTFVHGKVFWRGVVEKQVAALFPGIVGERLKTRVFKEIKVPKDLEAFLREVFV